VPVQHARAAAALCKQGLRIDKWISAITLKSNKSYLSVNILLTFNPSKQLALAWFEYETKRTILDSIAKCRGPDGDHRSDSILCLGEHAFGSLCDNNGQTLQLLLPVLVTMFKVGFNSLNYATKLATHIRILFCHC